LDYVQPPLHDAVGFREKTVSADVHPVTFVPNGSADAANGVGGFEQDRLDSGTAQQFERSG
jgi:hypothetical protein